MQDVLNAIKYLQAYGLAVESGVERFVDALPILIRQNMDRRAKGKLHSTYNQYMNSVRVKNQDYLLVVELDPEDWLSNAVETGIESFDMKDKALQSPKAKISKKGTRYLRIPMGKKKDAHAGTEKGQDFQSRVNEVLQKPKFGLSNLKIRPNGSVNETQKVLTSDPGLQGFYRTRVFENTQALQAPAKPKWNFVLFRTMSDNPEAVSKWIHPGIKAANIFKETERWINGNIDRILDDMIQSELDLLNSKMKK
jgi:hypothetical protein